MPVINEEIKKKARDIFEYMRDIRRTIHKKPEVGMKEFETAKLICSELKKMGIPYKEKVGGTGVVGLIKGNATGSGRCLGMRADMDALSVEERKEVEYASQIPGIMHACGHDGHVATLLGAAKILSQMKDEFSGSVKLIFQPAEEGPGGAKPMIKDGVLKDPDVDAIVAFHVGSGKITGNVGLRPGPVHAAQNEFHIKIKGV
ncbi:MAG: M20 family metallopeptidase, partial [Vulcanimicrobiota bacterium]